MTSRRTVSHWRRRGAIWAFALAFLVVSSSVTPLFAQLTTLTGSWTNTTFGSNGAASFSGGVVDDMLQFTFDLDGFVFGQANPDPVTLIGQFGPGSVIFQQNAHPFYGDIRIEFGFDGSMMINFDNVPNLGIDRLEASGFIYTDNPQIEAAYTVYFPGGGSAVGKISAQKQSGYDPERLFFSQVGNGGGLSSDVVLANTTDREVKGVVTFADKDGQELSFGTADGAAPAGGIPQAETSAVDFTLSPFDVVTISTDGQGEVRVGSAAAISDGPLGGVARFNLPGSGIAGVGGTGDPLTSFIIPVRRKKGGINTGVAIRNVSSTAVTLQLSLREGGVEVDSETIENFPANGHLAKYINELFSGVNTDDFAGSLVVRVEGGQVTATSLELGTNAGEFTALPVTALEADTP